MMRRPRRSLLSIFTNAVQSVFQLVVRDVPDIQPNVKFEWAADDISNVRLEWASDDASNVRVDWSA